MWALVVGPVVGLVAVLSAWPALRPDLGDGLLFAMIFLVSGLGVTIGYHRTFAHRALRPRRALKVVLALGGSTALEGGVIAWVAVHRTHHRCSDGAGDPHSPVGRGEGAIGVIRGFAHAHLGWMLRPHQPGLAEQVPDLTSDPDLVAIDKLFPIIALATLAFPLLIGWALHHSLAGALTTFVWAGLLRVGLTHHVTFSINSVCHIWGRQPFDTADQSRNVWWLAPLSLGESWHNNHHAFPRMARHGLGRGQLDLSAIVIRQFERLHWADAVHWPSAQQRYRNPRTGSRHSR